MEGLETKLGGAETNINNKLDKLHKSINDTNTHLELKQNEIKNIKNQNKHFTEKINHTENIFDAIMRIMEENKATQNRIEENNKHDVNRQKHKISSNEPSLQRRSGGEN